MKKDEIKTQENLTLEEIIVLGKKISWKKESSKRLSWYQDEIPANNIDTFYIGEVWEYLHGDIKLEVRRFGTNSYVVELKKRIPIGPKQGKFEYEEITLESYDGKEAQPIWNIAKNYVELMEKKRKDRIQKSIEGSIQDIRNFINADSEQELQEKEE